MFTTVAHPALLNTTRVLFNGTYVGQITKRGPASFRASRKNGEAGVDIRMLTDVRSFDAALVFVTRQTMPVSA